MNGQEIGNWVLEETIASGGMGDVYRARHKVLDTPAAVKVLQPQFSGAGEMQKRFGREAAIQAKLQHPNIARILDYHELDGRWYLVIEYLDHGSLADRMRRSGQVEIDQAVTWVRQALAGLHYAHLSGIVHRDLKPDNLMLDAHGNVRVTDFGIARDLKLTKMTQTGMTLGTPHYMSPEQLLTPEKVDERSDVYSMGVVLYELLAGRVPFDGSSFFQISQAQIEQTPPPIASLRPEVPPALVAIVERAMAKDPAARYPSCLAFEQALAAFATGAALPPLPPPVSAAAPGGTVLQTAPRPSSVVVQPGPQGGGSRGWQAATVALAVVGVVVAIFVWQLLKPGAGDAPSIADVVHEARLAEAAATGADAAAEKAEEAAAKAVELAEEVLAELDLERGPAKLGAAEAALEGARKAAEKATEGADSATEAHHDARTAAVGVGLDLDEAPSDEPELVAVLPQPGTPEARAAGRDAVAVAALAEERARRSASGAGGAIQVAEARIGQAERRLKDVQERRVAEQGADAREELEKFKEEQQAEIGKFKKEQEEKLAKLKEGGLPPGGLDGLTDAQKQQLLERQGPPGPLPEQPTVAVLSHGDPALAASFEQELERRLGRARLDIRDEHNSLAVSDMLRSPRPPEPRDLAPELLGAGFHVLVMISVEVGEQRHVELRGQRGNATGARLRMNAYDLYTSRGIGRGWSELVEYTELSAGAKARRALLKETSELATAIRDDWQRKRQL